MKIKIIIFFCLLLGYLPVFATEGQYAVSKINPALLIKANAVVRLEELRFEIVNPGKAVYKYHTVVTVLNENGDKWAEFAQYYDKFTKIESVEGVLYNSAGSVLKKIKTKDTRDVSGVSEISLIDDNRMKQHNFYHRAYPYTVEYETEIKYNSSLFFPAWTPQHDEHVAVEKSSVTIIHPSTYVLRYKEFNFSGTPTRVADGSVTSTTWAVTNLPAIVREPYAPLWHELTTMVFFAPTDFQVDNYKGNMNTWAEFGKFVHSLREGRDKLPDEIRKEVHRLTSNLTNTKEKIAVLYDYLQKNTRYISIQLGIGGWQPFDASFVASKSYGDCKALTNYMYSLLKEAGIPSFYTLIRAGGTSRYITLDFPSQQFNHVILCVPAGKDTVWLETTSQTCAPGYLGSFTGNRTGLLVSEHGGQLVSTPSYKLKDNFQRRKIIASLDTEGLLTTRVRSVYSGILQDQLHLLINGLSKDKVSEHLHEDLDFATYKVNDFLYKENRTMIPEIEETLDITVENYATVSGKRLFIVPNIMSRMRSKVSENNDRRYDIVFNTEYGESDSVEITIPEGYKPEAIPQDVSLNTRFGKYKSSVKLDGNKLIYSRYFESYSGRFPAKEYSQLVTFYQAISKADRSKVVFVKDAQ